MTPLTGIGRIVDMAGSRFELVARLGIGKTETAVLRTRMDQAGLCRCTAMRILDAFTFSPARSRCFLSATCQVGRW